MRRIGCRNGDDGHSRRLMSNCAYHFCRLRSSAYPCHLHRTHDEDHDDDDDHLMMMTKRRTNTKTGRRQRKAGDRGGAGCFMSMPIQIMLMFDSVKHPTAHELSSVISSAASTHSHHPRHLHRAEADDDDADDESHDGDDKDRSKTAKWTRKWKAKRRRKRGAG